MIEGLKSKPKAAIGEPETRTIVSPCTSFMLHKLLRMTSYVIGSSAFVLGAKNFRDGSISKVSLGT